MAKSNGNTGGNNKGPSKSSNKQRPTKEGFSRGIGKSESIDIGDKVDANITTTSTGPKGPANKKK